MSEPKRIKPYRRRTADVEPRDVEKTDSARQRPPLDYTVLPGRLVFRVERVSERRLAVSLWDVQHSDERLFAIEVPTDFYRDPLTRDRILDRAETSIGAKTNQSPVLLRARLGALFSELYAATAGLDERTPTELDRQRAASMGLNVTPLDPSARDPDSEGSEA